MLAAATAYHLRAIYAPDQPVANQLFACACACARAFSRACARAVRVRAVSWQAARTKNRATIVRGQRVHVSTKPVWHQQDTCYDTCCGTEGGAVLLKRNAHVPSIAIATACSIQHARSTGGYGPLAIDCVGIIRCCLHFDGFCVRHLRFTRMLAKGTGTGKGGGDGGREGAERDRDERDSVGAAYGD